MLPDLSQNSVFNSPGFIKRESQGALLQFVHRLKLLQNAKIKTNVKPGFEVNLVARDGYDVQECVLMDTFLCGLEGQ